MTIKAGQSEIVVYDYLQTRAPILFFILAADGRILEANNYAESVTKCRSCLNKFQDLIIDFSDSFNLNRLAAQSAKEHLLNIRTCSGLPQSFYFHFTTMGSTILAFGKIDAEEIENMRKEVLCLNQELNNMARQLHKKNAQLQRLNTEKNQFLGMAAHDLRKPIGLILSYSEFLMEEAVHSLDSEQNDFLKTIHDSSSYMKKLVDDFLDVSAIEAGRFELDLNPVDICRVLEQSLRLNRIQAIKKGIELSVQVEKNIPAVLIDASKIEQAIINLVSNAIEHTRLKTCVIIKLCCDQESIVFSVQDQGSGIDPQEMDNIFKPFEKTSAIKTAGEKSTGLGMMITHKIIQAHDGQLYINSELGKGTTITFTLPLKK